MDHPNTVSVNFIVGKMRLGGSDELHLAAMTSLASQLEVAFPTDSLPTKVRNDHLEKIHALAQTLGAFSLSESLDACKTPFGYSHTQALETSLAATLAELKLWLGSVARTPTLQRQINLEHGTSYPAKILVIDDQPIAIQVVHAILKDSYQVLMATNGVDGLNVFRTHTPELVLLDVEMPGKNGLIVAKELRSLPGGESVPIIFVTAHNNTDEETACWDAGGIDFINKPVNATTLQNRVRSHLMLKRQSDLLRQYAYIDGLTKLANRRIFDERLQDEAKRSHREGSELSLLLADIDFFKRYNDQYGHPAGDECLRKVAAAFRQVANRPGDLAARYGGEEFALILPNTDLNGATNIAARLCDAVRALAIEHLASDVASEVTISVGGITQTAAVDCEQLIARADEQLYLAKKAGRARYILTSAMYSKGK